MASRPDEAADAFRELVGVIKALRTPGSGCPWDLEQDHRSLRPYLLEEAHEVLDAIERGDDGALREELGDLLLQVVLHAQIAADRGAFTIDDVARDIAAKMVRRHPHVFGSTQADSSAAVVRNWEAIKASEASARGVDPSVAAAMERLPPALPALQRAQRLGEKAARAGFDWDTLDGVLAKVREELAELETELAGSRRERLEQELGDVFFSLCQLARWLGIGAEDSLRACNRRFVARVRRLEALSPRPLQERTKEELLADWSKAKEDE